MFRALLRRRVPFIPQMEGVECGAACLAMVLATHGHHAPLSEVRQAVGVSRDGTSAAKLLRGAEGYGLDAQGFKVEIEDLKQLPLPAILHWDLYHFVVLESITRKGVWLVDPACGKRFIPFDTLGAHFTGVVLAFEPGPEFLPRAPRRPSVERYLAAIRSRRSALGMTLLISLLLQVLGLVAPVAQKLLLDQVILPRQDAWFWGVGLAMILALLVQMGLSFTRHQVLQTLQASIDIRLLSGFLRHLLRLPMAFFLQRQDGDLVSRMESNVVIQQLVSERTVSSLLDGLSLCGYAALMLAYHPLLGSSVILLGLVRVGFQLWVRRTLKQAVQSELAADGAASAVLFESLGALETIKASGAEGTFVRRWIERHVNAANASLKRRILEIRMGALLNLIGQLSLTGVFLLAGREVLNHQMTLGTFSAFLTLQGLFLTPLGGLMAGITQLQMASGHLTRLDDVMRSDEEPTGTRHPDDLSGRIRLEQVSFAYTGAEAQAVQDITLEIHPGEKLAICGPTGAGKSTLARLLLGMHLPSRGTIQFDGIHLADYDLARFRNRMGVVLQETFLLNASIRENLLLNNPDLTQEDLETALRLADLEAFVQCQPLGLDAEIGENGSRLSGGQRQRLAIARALVHRPAILLLDEATSSLDLETEARVHANLAHYGCTRILIAHRLATVRDADRILVMDQGRMVQIGDYANLLRQPGLFRLMVDSAEATHA